MTIHVGEGRAADGARDHEGTSAPLKDVPSVTTCSACGKTWPTRFGVVAPRIWVVSKAVT
jgi:hypothetical protein